MFLNQIPDNVSSIYSINLEIQATDTKGIISYQ